MAQVVLLRGVNVGGHRSFRPTMLARQLDHLGVVNIGAAGSFVVHERVSKSRLREAIGSALPFEADIVICDGRDLLSLTAGDPFADYPASASLVRFVSFLTRNPTATPALPHSVPPGRGWLVRVIDRRERFVLGVYRRHMKTIGHLGALDRLFGVPVTTRNWSTVLSIARALASRPPA